MEIYLVGGAVRDKLLGRPVRERDWVVVGGSPEALEAKGYRRVGKNFPVFLHPDTGEEYALARTESKTGPGYHGFSVYAGADVSLKDDLQRRDLSINAMAETRDGQIIDPWGGRSDLEAGILRHVSPAFREDPVRVLRVARFAARYQHRGFRVAPETIELMQSMVASGEVDALVAERAWKETESALAEKDPAVFFETLRECNALAHVFPEIDALFGVPQPAKWHPEIDTGIHVMMTLRVAATMNASTEVRFATLVHDLGKGTTPESEWPSHPGHEERGAILTKQLCKRLGVPNGYRDLGVLAALYHTLVHRAFELRPATLLKLLDNTDAFRRPERFQEFLQSCEIDSRGRLGREQEPYPQAGLVRKALNAASGIRAASLAEAGLQGPALGEALQQGRLEAIKACLAEQKSGL